MIKGNDVAGNLTMWKPTVVIPVKPSETLARRIKDMFPGRDFSKFADKLDPVDSLAVVWPEPPLDVNLHVFISLPESGRTRLYDVAHNLYRDMWRQDLTTRLQDVDGCEGFKYLPATEVNGLRLRELGLNAKVMLLRGEYIVAFNAMEARRVNTGTGGIVVTGHPGIGKSVFIYYALLRLLSKGQPAALQYNKCIVTFREDGVEIHEDDSYGRFFREGEKLWALTDSNERSRVPCKAFQNANTVDGTWIVLATSPAKNRYDRLREELALGVFVMNYLSRDESRALSIIHGVDVEGVLRNYDTWGPSARTCLHLAWGMIEEMGLKMRVDAVAKNFAENPRAMTMRAEFEDAPHCLFTSLPGPKRSITVLRVATPYLRDFVVKAIARIHADKQASFYTEVTSHNPYFRSAFGYIFEKFFYLWFSSDPDNQVSCTAWPDSESAEPIRTTGSTRDPVALEHLRPVGLDKVIVYGGEASATGYKSANEHQTPFGWIPASRSDATFDALVCTDTHIITIQVVITTKHSIKEKAFERLIKNLPGEFRKDRCWCHVFVTDCKEAATELGRKKYSVNNNKMKVLIHTAVLNISCFQYHREVLDSATVPRSDPDSADGMDVD